jgi:hypothetical protein
MVAKKARVLRLIYRHGISDVNPRVCCMVLIPEKLEYLKNVIVNNIKCV